MRREEIEELDRLEETYWWHVGRRTIITQLIESFVRPARPLTILDVGCGTGRTLEVLAAYGAVFGSELSPDAVEAARRRGRAGRLVRASAMRLPFGDAAFDLVTALDLLEHLDDDQAGLREMRRVLRPGGHVLISVPAYRFLWSEHDEAVSHRRRYMASELHGKLNVAGFAVLKRTYAISLAFPLIVGYRVWRGLFPAVDRRNSSYVVLPRLLNRSLVRMLEVEASAVRSFNLPVGSSVFAVARRAR